MSSSKMNNFLHRMLNKGTCEESESQPAEGQKKSNAIRSGFPKGNWIKKLGNYSANKHQVPSTPPRTNTMKAVDKSSPSNPDAVTLRKTSSSPSTPLEMPDLESIIREFERGFLSPTKTDSPADGCKQNNFVKKIVAAFEVKYNTYSDLKMAQETEENHEGSKEADSHEASKRKAWIFGGSPFKTNLEETKFDKRSDNCSPLNQSQVEGSAKSTCCSPLKENSDVCKRRSGVFVSPFRNLFEETAAEDEIQKENNRRSGIFFSPSKDKKEEDAKSRRRSGIFSSPFNRRDSKDTSGSSEIYSSPVKLDRQDSKDSSSDCSSLFKFDKEESFRKSDFHFAPLKISSLDDTKNIGDIELDVTLPEPEETISLNGSTLPKTSTRMDEFAKENSVPPGVEKVSTRIDKTPKIVGAFLKKPIEVEDTSIDWIPITGKKLPRKKSLKKLLYSLTGKKLERKGKLFSSERNLNEEPRELQDSGYDERSCSSSSLSSLVSVSEVLMQQENGYAEPERRSLKTFRSRNSIDEEEEEDEAFCERHRSASLPYRKQLLLTEVPRENVKLDLGPCYPSPKVVTMSLDRKAMSKKARSPSPIYDRLPRLPKHPNLSKIPKHPFVSLTKMDDALLQGSRDNSNAEYPRGEESSIVVKNDLYEVEFRRSFDDLCFSASRRSSSSEESNYDVPRRFLSKSENEISSLFKSLKDKNGKETIYDVPRPRSAERPKSSVFEEAVALKRRCFSFEKRIGGNIYAVPRDLELHRDVAKTMNAKIGLNNAAVRSLYDLTRAETRSAF